MNNFEKASLILHGFAIGCFFVRYLIVSILLENIMLFMLVSLLFIAINRIKSRENKSIYIKLVTFGIIIGYIFSTFFIYNDGVEIHYPSENIDNNNKKDAIIFVFPSNPSLYQQDNWSQIIRNSNEFSEIQKKIFPALLLNKYKNIYKKIGMDSSDKLSTEFFLKLKKSNITKDKNLYMSYLNHKPILEEQTIKAIQGGAEKIQIVNILLDQSDKWSEVQERIEKVRYYNYNTQISYTHPLWESEELQGTIFKRISENTFDTNKKNTAILFVGKGYEDRVGDAYKESVNQQILFSRGIKDKLIFSGYEEDKVKISYLNSAKFSVKKVMLQLLDQGISDLIIVPIHIPFDTIENKVIIPDIIKKIEIPPSIRTTHLPAWNLQQDFTNEINKMIDAVEDGS